MFSFFLKIDSIYVILIGKVKNAQIMFVFLTCFCNHMMNWSRITQLSNGCAAKLVSWSLQKKMRTCGDQANIVEEVLEWVSPGAETYINLLCKLIDNIYS
jgi:hypothetical protein